MAFGVYWRGGTLSPIQDRHSENSELNVGIMHSSQHIAAF
jgi:hypothetical protein